MLLVELRRAEAEPLAEEGEALPSELRPKITKGKGPRHPLLWQYASVLIGLGLAFTSFIVLVQRKELSEIRRTSGGGILTLAPEIDQALSGPIVFRWLADPDAEYYVLELFDKALLPVWVSERIHGTQMNIPPEVRSRLEYGQAYFWMISAYAQEAVIEGIPSGPLLHQPSESPRPLVDHPGGRGVALKHEGRPKEGVGPFRSKHLPFRITEGLVRGLPFDEALVEFAHENDRRLIVEGPEGGDDRTGAGEEEGSSHAQQSLRPHEEPFPGLAGR